MERHQFPCHHHNLMAAAISIYFLIFCLRGVHSCTQQSSVCINGTFLNSSGCCEECQACDRGRMYYKSRCNMTHNAQCECHSPQYFVPRLNRCVLDCKLCPITKLCGGTERCKCENDCYADHDKFCLGGEVKCNGGILVSEDGSVEATRSGAPKIEETFPSWGIGLVAIGVVIGIIIFASCFLCLGLFTISKHRDSESHGSETSESGLVMRSSFSSIGTESSFLSTGYPYLTSHSMLELLKNSNPQLLSHTSNSGLGNGGPASSSQRSSPINNRDSPRPVRTIKLVKHSDKLSAVVL